MNKRSKALLTEFSRGGEIIFDNATQLFNEANLLRQHGALSRALCLHQISNEECGKLEILGWYAMTVVLGGRVNYKQMAKRFRDHKAKNYANSYFAAVVGEERAAKKRRDWVGARKAFRKVQVKLHEVFNSGKNTALYVDFSEGKFIAPKSVITEHDVTAMAALNKYFLDIAAPSVRLLRRLETDEWGFREAGKTLATRLQELYAQMPRDPDKALGIAYQEALEALRDRAKRGE